MKIVSFKTARALQDKGFPSLKADWSYSTSGELVNFVDDADYVISAPYIMEAWLWLWRTKKVYFGVNTEDYPHEGMCLNDYEDRPYSDPEEAIENAIMYLVENDLLK